MLFNGVLLGITGLLAIFLTAIFAANHRAIFPATALVAWAALAYFCVDFGFWNKLFPVGPDRTALYRAAAEAGLAASLVLFLYTFLRIGLWHGWIKTLFWGWIAVAIRADLRRHRRPGLCLRAGARLAGRCRRRRHRADRLFRAARPGPCAVADPELDAAYRLAVRRRHGRARQAVRRPRRLRPGRRSGADPGAARLHRDAIRLPLGRRSLELRVRRASFSSSRWRSTAPAPHVFQWNAGRDQITVANESSRSLGSSPARSTSPSTTSCSICTPPTASGSG